MVEDLKQFSILPGLHSAHFHGSQQGSEHENGQCKYINTSPTQTITATQRSFCWYFVRKSKGPAVQVRTDWNNEFIIKKSYMELKTQKPQSALISIHGEFI